MLTQERLKELLSYDPLTGLFVWLRAHRSIKIGDAAGGLDENGYVRIRVDGKKYRAHRLAWLYMTGHWPEDQIDHRDLDKANNVFTNLRAANNTQNNGNRKRQSNNTSGHRGVYWWKTKSVWRSIIYVNKRQICLGTFHTKKEAAMAYAKAHSERFGEFARTG